MNNLYQRKMLQPLNKQWDLRIMYENYVKNPEKSFASWKNEEKVS